MSDHGSQILPIPQAMQEKMRGMTWHEDLPSPRLHELRLLEIPYLNFAGKEALGTLVTSAALGFVTADLLPAADLTAIGSQDGDQLLIELFGP